MMYNTPEILRHFGINASEIRIERISTGHVNQTFKIYSECGQYILQKINADIFREPEKVMHNIEAAQKMICKGMEEDGINPAGKIPVYLKAKDKNFLIENGFWRIYRYIESIDRVPDKKSVNVFGKLLGQFHRYTEKADTSELYDTIRDFHNIEKNISAALECDGISKKASEVLGHILNFYTKNKDCLSPERLVHNDVKWANVLISPKTLLPEAIIDYDTVMKGYAAFDFGDAVRSACITDNFTIDTEMLSSLANGYKSEYGKLCAEEQALGILAISAELSARYLSSCIGKRNEFPAMTVSERLSRHENMLLLSENILNNYDCIMTVLL